MSADRFQLWQVFVRVVETGSFSAVAREFDSTQPRISKQVAALEAQLGVRLLRRSTRKLSLTDEGERLYGDAKRIIEDVVEIESRVKGADRPRGTLRVACPSALSRIKLLSMAADFVRDHAELKLDFVVSDRFVDLVEDGIDVAVRIGEVGNTDLHAKRIGTARRICVAAPAYLDRRGTPTTPADLHQHDCVLYTLLATGTVWPFERMPVRVTGRVQGSSPEVVAVLAQKGLGIAMAPDWLFAEALAAGQLREILTAWPLAELPIHLLYPVRRQVPLRVRMFVDHLTAAFAADQSLAVRRPRS